MPAKIFGGGPWLGCWAILCALALPVAADGETPAFEVVDAEGVYFGTGKHPKSPGEMLADDVWAEIPEYRRIIDEELTEDDPEYHLLLKRATERFQGALKKLAKRESYDMLAEAGAIRANGDKEIPDVTEDMIDLVTRDS
jgi:hypothetical protein